ncbi:hypothetical protein AB0M19_31730, partial [Streptomyces sp. NPDC051920]
PASFPPRAPRGPPGPDGAVRARGDLTADTPDDGPDPLDVPLEDGTPAAHPGGAHATHAPARQTARDPASGHDGTTRSDGAPAG